MALFAYFWCYNIIINRILAIFTSALFEGFHLRQGILLYNKKIMSRNVVKIKK